jgi:hypothetical protein
MPHGIYCYKVMTFGLKNAGATYQKAIQKLVDTKDAVMHDFNGEDHDDGGNMSRK